MILAESLSFRHRGAERDALSGVSFRLEAGQLCCLLGVNGSGKSTLLALLCGIYVPDAGSLTVRGRLPGPGDTRGPDHIRAALVPQDPDLYILGSLVEEDLLLALDPKDAVLRRKALDLAERFGLSQLLRQPVQTLSYGQKRKLCLASALVSDPEALLLDEPFAGLDHPGTLIMREALARNREAGITQVVTGHDLDLVADLADTFLLLEAGRLIRQGGAAEVFPLLRQHGVRPPCWWFEGKSSPLWI